jgi:hypothetical protein
MVEEMNGLGKACLYLCMATLVALLVFPLGSGKSMALQET